MVEDLDGDGTEDHYDLDIDGDGFSNAVEIAYGSNPLDPNSVANAAPNSLELNCTTILENRPIGSLVGQLIGQDPDGNTTLTYSFVDGNGSIDNSLFVIDENASVRTTNIFDYETNEHNYSIRIQVADEHNFSIERAFTINLINIVEDNDQDGVEDHYDLDDDNDGFSDLEELSYGSDPMDGESVVNQPPIGINITKGGEFWENEPVGGRVIARFVGLDPDVNDSLSYQLVTPQLSLGKEREDSHKEGNYSRDADLPFHLSKKGGLRTLRVFDYESDEHNYSLTVRVTDSLDTSFEKTFLIHLRNVVEDIDEDGIEDAFDKDIDGDGFSNLTEFINGTDPADPYSLTNLAILETFEATVDENGSILLGGSVQSTGNGKIEDFGMILSSSVNQSLSDGHWIRGEGEPVSFSLKVTNSPISGILYYRAWAKNAAGYGTGAVKKVIVPEPSRAWWGRSQELPGGWRSSDWFGIFRQDRSGWIYHEDLRWVYHAESKDASIWLWKKGRGWLWTKEAVWPYLWSDRNGNWLYLVRGRKGSPVFFDYINDSYTVESLK